MSDSTALPDLGVTLPDPDDKPSDAFQPMPVELPLPVELPPDPEDAEVQPPPQKKRKKSGFCSTVVVVKTDDGDMTISIPKYLDGTLPDDLIELYSIPRLCPVARDSFGMRAVLSIDKEVGWDLGFDEAPENPLKPPKI